MASTPTPNSQVCHPSGDLSAGDRGGEEGAQPPGGGLPGHPHHGRQHRCGAGVVRSPHPSVPSCCIVAASLHGCACLPAGQPACLPACLPACSLTDWLPGLGALACPAGRRGWPALRHCLLPGVHPLPRRHDDVQRQAPERQAGRGAADTVSSAGRGIHQRAAIARRGRRGEERLAGACSAAKPSTTTPPPVPACGAQRGLGLATPPSQHYPLAAAGTPPPCPCSPCCHSSGPQRCPSSRWGVLCLGQGGMGWGEGGAGCGARWVQGWTGVHELCWAPGRSACLGRMLGPRWRAAPRLGTPVPRLPLTPKPDQHSTAHVPTLARAAPGSHSRPHPCTLAATRTPALQCQY